MDRLVAAGGLREWAPRAFSEFARIRPLHAIGTRGYPWIEIDFPQDYQRAQREVLPRLPAARRADAVSPNRSLGSVQASLGSLQ